MTPWRSQAGPDCATSLLVSLSARRRETPSSITRQIRLRWREENKCMVWKSSWCQTASLCAERETEISRDTFLPGRRMLGKPNQIIQGLGVASEQDTLTGI